MKSNAKRHRRRYEMTRKRSYRRFQARKAKKQAELLYRIWRVGDAPPSEPEERFRQQWVGMMAGCHGVPCSCFMCGNGRKFRNELTLAEKRSQQSMRDILKDEYGLTA